MAKATTQFVCNECGYVSPRWLGKCPGCEKFNTFIEEVVAPTPSVKKATKNRASSAKAIPVNAVQRERLTRIKSGMAEFDNVLGGGIVPASLVLIGGDPGVGKSTLLTQIAANLSKERSVLYVSAEESCAQVKLRCERLGVAGEKLFLLNETCLEDVIANVGEHKFVIIDSIQAVYTEELSSTAGSVGQVKECATRLMRLAKSKGVTFFIIGHVTKEGALAGPKVLEHVMDTVLYFEGDGQENFKILRSVKNRFGSVQEVGVFEMREDGVKGVADYAGLFLSESRGEAAGSAVTPSETGNRCMMVEVQALVAKTAYGLPRRMTLGVDYNKLIVLLAVLEKRCGVPFFNADVYCNAMGGMKLGEPSVDLAICAALSSGATGKILDKYTALFGEVGLTGEVRGVSFADKRVNECIKMGFKKVVIPKKNLPVCEKYKDKIEIIPVSYVNQMLKALELR
ncbi:MAG: DNA repair protein RadA [Clostridia bacterium]|nr:DNA repair protein RadA [Clostridia bacterium]